MQFIEPIWLWAIAGITVPLFIHLWNIRDGKTFKVGSIRFLTENSKSHAKSLKLSEWLLLLLRCLLLVALALLIAKPFMSKQTDASKDKGWFLAEKADTKEVYKHFRTTIDSLTKAGYTFHYFDTTFLEKSWVKAINEPVDSPMQNLLPYWSILKLLGQKVPATLPVWVFTGKGLHRFSGSRPELAMNLTWKMYDENDSSKWVHKAYMTWNNSIYVITGYSKSSGTYYKGQTISAADDSSGYKVSVIDGKTFIARAGTLAHGNKNMVEVDTSTLDIEIYSRFQPDANYLIAAVKAIRAFTGRKITLRMAANVQDVSQGFDWLFWLSEEPVPPALVKNNIFTYKKGHINNGLSKLVITAARPASYEPVAVYKMIGTKALVGDEYKAIWTDGYGQPLLKLEQKQASVYHFFNRFNPAWNDLVWSSSFPMVIYNLLYGSSDTLGTNVVADRRIIDEEQVQPVIHGASMPLIKQNFKENRDLNNVLWLIAFTLFVIERVVSFRLKR